MFRLKMVKVLCPNPTAPSKTPPLETLGVSVIKAPQGRAGVSSFAESGWRSGAQALVSGAVAGRCKGWLTNFYLKKAFLVSSLRFRCFLEMFHLAPM